MLGRKTKNGHNLRFFGGRKDECLLRRTRCYAHHVVQWKEDFANGHSSASKAKSQTELKHLKNENKALKKDLNRKEKALAETAALLVLQKKVNGKRGNDDDD